MIGKRLAISLIFLIFMVCRTAFGNISNGDVSLLPEFPGDEPFVILLEGLWPNSCSPGLFKPVVRNYTNETVLIEFGPPEQPLNCVGAATEYRVLVDMRPQVDAFGPPGESLEITFRFQGRELVESRRLFCGGGYCGSGDLFPEALDSGLYVPVGIDRQGLLLSRQNDTVALYPLTYDETGDAEWNIASGILRDGVVFTDLLKVTGGACLDCDQGSADVQTEKVGTLTLVDSETGPMVKINDGYFLPFTIFPFGYGSATINEEDGESMPNLSGRWAFSFGDFESFPNGSQAAPSALPWVFDLALESGGDGAANYRLSSPNDDEGIAILRCVNPRFCIIVVKFGDSPGLETTFSVEVMSLTQLLWRDSGPTLAVGRSARTYAKRLR